MSKRTVILTICDKCEKEITGRLTYKTCPCCGKDVCLACINKEDAKHKPREKKQKKERPLLEGTADLTIIEEPSDSVGKEVTPEVADEKGSPDISTFTISIGQEEEDHKATLGNRTVKAETLKECAEELLTFHGIDRKYIEDAPDSDGKQGLISILDANKKEDNDARD